MKLDDVRVFERRENGELLLDTAEAVDDGASRDASAARDDGLRVGISTFIQRVVWVEILDTPFLSERLKRHVDFWLTLEMECIQKFTHYSATLNY